MVQHVLLLAVAPPLLVLGAPVPALLWSLPTAGVPRVSPAGAPRAVAPRRGLDPVDGHRARRADRSDVGLARPRAVRRRRRHTTASTSSSTPPIWLRLPVLVVASRPGLTAATAPPHSRVLVGALPGTALGAALTLASRRWYAPYPSMADQQLAGVVMWAFAGAAYVIAAGALVGVWLSSLDREERASRRPWSPARSSAGNGGR